MDRTQLDAGLPPPRAPSEPLAEPRSLGDYRILRRLGEGGMGAVYLGYHTGQGAQVALKVLSDQLASNPAYVDRFYREFRSSALLNHPNIVRGLSVGQDRASARHYLVLEFVDGPSALALLEQHGRLSVGDAVHIALDVARALEHAQTHNIVHRDIKPDNILITRSGVAKLADLGLAKQTNEASHLTATRQGFGTPYYMPYEQAINARLADARSDIYALGATLYHLVVGEVPFPGANQLEVMDRKMVGEFAPASSRNPKVPAVLDRILERMLARHPDDRYQTASELIVDLERSRLAAPMLSFADPALALRDPWVQACLSASGQPTVPDLQAVAKVPESVQEFWYVRWSDRKGRLRRFRLTAGQLERHLRDGRVPTRAEASREPQGVYRSLSAYAEFREVRPLRSRKFTPAPARPSAATAVLPGPGVRWFLAGIGLGLLLVAVMLWLIFHLLGPHS